MTTPFELEWQLRSGEELKGSTASSLDSSPPPPSIQAVGQGEVPNPTFSLEVPPHQMEPLSLPPLTSPRPLSRSLWPVSPTLLHSGITAPKSASPHWCTLAYYTATPRMFLAALSGSALFSFFLTFLVTYTVLAARLSSIPPPSPPATTTTPQPFWPPYVEEASTAEWSYKYGSSAGPEVWGDIVDTGTREKPYSACYGTSQSPLDLPPFRPYSSLPPTAKVVGQSMAYSTTPTWQVASRPGGHPGFQMEYDTAFTPSQDYGNITIGGALYALVQFHFHSPSEHTVGGYRYPLEVHFLHRQVANPANIAVLSILYNHSSTHNPALDAFWMEIFHAKTGLAPISIPALFAQTTRISQSYTGSLTTPPCTEGVLWHVLESSVGVNPVQSLVYTYALNGIANYRSPQALNSRTITQSQFF